MHIEFDKKMNDMVHFLHLARGSNYLRSHGGRTYLFYNGAFRLFNGVSPESVLQMCAEFAPYVAGRLWYIDKKRPIRDDVVIYEALYHLFRAETLASGRDETPVAVAQSVGGSPMGTKRMRPWLLMEEAEFPPTPPRPTHPSGRTGNIHGTSGLCFG